MPDDKPKQANETLVATPIGIVACALLVCSWITNTIAITAIESLIYLGIVFAFAASALGFLGLAKNSHCKASAAASGIGLIVAITGIAIAMIGVKEMMS